MDWTRAIEINRAALTRIIAGLLAMMELVRGDRISRRLYRVVVRSLCPAESAVRRLIVIAARGLTVNPAPARLMPRGVVFAGGGGGRVSFRLFDARKRFGGSGQWNPAGVSPRIHVFDAGPLVPLFQARPAVGPEPVPDATLDAARLGRRLAAVRMALENLPREARRMARWLARRDRKQGSGLRSPLRPGPPPGHRRTPTDDVDRVLRECHALAGDALNEDSS